MVYSPCEYSWKNFAFTSKQCLQVPEHFEIRGKTFTVQTKTAKTVKVLTLECFVLYSIRKVQYVQLIKLIIVNIHILINLFKLTTCNN